MRRGDERKRKGKVRKKGARRGKKRSDGKTSRMKAANERRIDGRERTGKDDDKHNREARGGVGRRKSKCCQCFGGRKQKIR